MPGDCLMRIAGPRKHLLTGGILAGIQGEHALEGDEALLQSARN